MKSIISKLNPKLIRFASLEFFFWATCSTYYPFLVVFLIDRGYNNTTIGTLLAINSFTVIFAQPFWGMVSDWIRSVKKVFIFCIAFSACIILSMPLYESVLLLGLMLAIITFFESAMAPLMDSWVIQGIKTEQDISYGNIRLWGSIGFSITAYILGVIVDHTSIYTIFPAYAILAALTVLRAVKVKVDNPAEHRTSFADLKIERLLHNYYYVVFLIFAIVLFVPHRGSFMFLAQLMEEVGGTGEQLGLCFSIMAISEVPIFLCSKHLIKKFKPVHLILASTIFFIFRQVLLLLASTPTDVILLQVLQGPSFALFLTGAVYYVDSLAPQELKSTAQTVASAVFFGGSGVIGSLGGGWFLDHLSLTQMYQTGVIISVVISVFFVISFPVGKWLVQKSQQTVKDI